VGNGEASVNPRRKERERLNAAEPFARDAHFPESGVDIIGGYTKFKWRCREPAPTAVGVAIARQDLLTRRSDGKPFTALSLSPLWLERLTIGGSASGQGHLDSVLECPVAQLAEHLSLEQKVDGSSPSWATNKSARETPLLPHRREGRFFCSQSRMQIRVPRTRARCGTRRWSCYSAIPRWCRWRP
jgi:hypothetical protein